MLSFLQDWIRERIINLKAQNFTPRAKNSQGNYISKCQLFVHPNSFRSYQCKSRNFVKVCNSIIVKVDIKTLCYMPSISLRIVVRLILPWRRAIKACCDIRCISTINYWVIIQWNCVDWDSLHSEKRNSYLLLSFNITWEQST